MLCQHCGKHEALYHFTVNTDSGTAQVHLCPECAQTLARQYQAWFSGPMAGWPMMAGSDWNLPGTAMPFGTPSTGEDRFPATADERLRRRRQIGELRFRLKKAVEDEDYETAAKLRDEIAGAERAMRGSENKIPS